MASSSSSYSQTHPLHAEEDEDYTLVDSFLNYHYDPNAMDVKESLQSQSSQPITMEVKEPLHERVPVPAPVMEHEPALELELVPTQEHKYENVENWGCVNSIEKVVVHINGESGNRADVSNEDDEIEEGEIIESDDGIEDGEIVSSDDVVDSDNNDTIPSPVPHVDTTLKPHHQMVPVGDILSIMDVKVIVKSTMQHNPLNVGSVLWLTERGTPLGLIDEIIGPVESPYYYCVRYNSENEVPVGINEKTSISYVPEFAKHYKKECDESGVNEQEVPNEVDFSDDEKEFEYKRATSNDQNPRMKENNRPEVPTKRSVVLALPAPNAPPMFSHRRGRGHRSLCVGTGRGCVAPAPSSASRPGRGRNSLHSGTGQGLGESTPSSGTRRVRGRNSLHSGTGQGRGAQWFQPNSHTAPSQQLPAVHYNPQPQNSMHPPGFPSNGAQWFQPNSHTHNQFPMPGIPFEQQFSPTIFQCSSLQGNQHPPYQFHPGLSNRGRTMSPRGKGRRGYQPTK